MPCVRMEKIMLISKEKRQEAVDYSMKTIRKICEEIGPRESGMPNERKAQEFMKKEMLDNGWADSAEIEDFTISRHALVGFTKIIGVLLIVGALVQLLRLIPDNPTAILAANIVTIVMAGISLIITVGEFLFYIPLIDRFLPRTQSCNVYAKYEPTGEVKRRIVINGHADSAYEWTLMKIRQEVMVGVLVVDLLCLFATLGIFIYSAIVGDSALWPMIFALCTIVPFIGLFYVCSFKHLSPGANDNLTGCFAAISVLKCLKESGIRFENTEVCALLTGAEEAGLRGATAWAKKHEKEWQDVETYVVAFDTLTDYDYFTIYQRDMTSLIANSKEVCELLDEACADPEVNHPLPHGGVPFGASDAAALSRCGVKAACVAGQNPKYAPYYHNRRDVPDALKPDSFALGLDIALAATEAFDRKGK